MKDERSNYHDLDLEKADQPVWVTKCPVVVAKAWEKQGPSSSSYSESNSMGKIVHSQYLLQTDSSLPEFIMEMNGAESWNIPKCYALNMFKDFVPMGTFSVDNQDYPSFEGNIEYKVDMKPHGEDNIDEYARLCRERTSKTMAKNRQIQVLDNDRGVHMTPMPGMAGLVSSNSKGKRKPDQVKETGLKRTRRDRGELEVVMFKLFESKPNWTLKRLVQETNQPPQFLKEILNELCVYNKRGLNQGTYELKPEYKIEAAEDGTSRQ